MINNPYTQTILSSLVVELAKHPIQCKRDYLSVSFYQRHQMLFYKLTNTRRSSHQTIKHPFSFSRLTVDGKSIGGHDTTILVLVKQLTVLLRDALQIVFENYILAQVNVDTFEVLRDKSTISTTYVDTKSECFHLQFRIFDPVNDLAFANLVSIIEDPKFNLLAHRKIALTTTKKPPYYTAKMDVQLDN